MTGARSKNESQLLRKKIEELQSQLAEARGKVAQVTGANDENAPVSAPNPEDQARALEAALRESKNRAEWLARLPGENPNPVVRASSDGIVIYHNRAAGSVPGWECAMDQPVPSTLLPYVEYALTHEKPVEAQVALKGNAYWVYVAPFPNDGYANVYGRNISAHKQAEEEVLHSRDLLHRLNLELQERNAELEMERARWQGVVEGIVDEVWVCDAKGRMSVINAPTTETHDFEEAAEKPVQKGMEDLEILTPEGKPRPVEETPLLRSLAGQVVHGEEIVRNRRTGKLGYRQYSSAPTRDAQGHITGAVAIVRDITALKAAERALAESRNRVNDILMSLGDGLLAVNAEWQVVYINPTATRIAGKPAEELIGGNLWELWPSLVGSPLEGLYREVMQDGIPRQARIRGLERRTRWYDVNVYPSSDGITIYYSDKTEQVGAEEARAQLLAENQEQRELLETILDTDPGGIALFTRCDLRFKFVNEAYRALLPLPGQDPVGRTLEEVWPPELGFHVMASYLPPGREDEPVTHDKITRRFPDGSTRHFSVHLRPIQWHGERATLVVAWEITQIEDAKAKLEEYAEKLKRSNQDLQDFAMIASHDLQEPLRKIETFGDMLALRASGLDERSREHVERMKEAAKRMRGMVEGLLQLSRVSTDSGPFSEVDLTKLAEEVVSDLGNQVRRTHGLVQIGAMPQVEGDPQQLRQLLQNLISNGLKYHKPDVEPLVKLSGRRLPETVEILVEDNGIGFEQEQAERIFQPFNRLVSRAEFEGSGMGLAICRRIVERHRGQIGAVSSPGQGARFVVTLPVHAPQSMDKSPAKEKQDE